MGQAQAKDASVGAAVIALTSAVATLIHHFARHVEVQVDAQAAQQAAQMAAQQAAQEAAQRRKRLVERALKQLREDAQCGLRHAQNFLDQSGNELLLDRNGRARDIAQGHFNQAVALIQDFADIDPDGSVTLPAAYQLPTIIGRLRERADGASTDGRDLSRQINPYVLRWLHNSSFRLVYGVWMHVEAEARYRRCAVTLERLV
jgi:hypothetical protein